MFLTDVLFAFLIAVILTSLLLPRYRRRAPNGDATTAAILFFFAIIFLATWAGGLWITPFGPVMYGVSWVPLILFGIFVALILAAAVPPSSPRVSGSSAQGVEEGVDIVLISLFALLLVFIVTAYFV